MMPRKRLPAAESGLGIPLGLAIAAMLVLAVAAPAEAGQRLLAALDPADASEVIEGGAEALDSFWDYPWYDSAKDDVRPIAVKPPPPPKPPRWRWNWNWNWSGQWIVWLAWGAIAVLLVVLVYLMVQGYIGRAREATGRSRTSGRRDLDRVEALPFDIRKPAADFLEEARRLYGLGRYSEAMIYLYSHQLLELDKNNFIRLAKGKTNRQYLRELWNSQAVSRLLERSMVAFEDFFFGGHALDRARFESCYGNLDEFHRLVRQEPA